MWQPAQAACRLGHLHARASALARRVLWRGRPCRRLRSGHARLAGALEVRPREHSLDAHRHEHAVGVVGAQPAIPEQSRPRGPHETCRCRAHALGQHLPIGIDLIARRPLHEHEARFVGEAVLARMVGERDARVLLDPVELAPEAERRGEANGCSLAVAQADWCDRRDHGAAGRGHVCERCRQIAADDVVLEIGPHGCEPTQPRVASGRPAGQTRRPGSSARRSPSMDRPS